MAPLARVLGILSLVLVFLVPSSASAFIFTPMGGFVTFVRPCNTGYLITVINPKGIGSGEFMWTPGTISFLYGPPLIHTWVLGMSDVPLPCVIGTVVHGHGKRITFHGSSLPAKFGSESAGSNSVINGYGLY